MSLWFARKDDTREVPPTEACQDLKLQDAVMLTHREGVSAQNLQVQGLRDYLNGFSETIVKGFLNVYGLANRNTGAPFRSWASGSPAVYWQHVCLKSAFPNFSFAADLPWILLGRWSYFAWCEGMRHLNEIDGKDEGMVGERCQHGISSFGVRVAQVLWTHV